MLAVLLSISILAFKLILSNLDIKQFLIKMKIMLICQLRGQRLSCLYSALQSPLSILSKKSFPIPFTLK